MKLNTRNMTIMNLNVVNTLCIRPCSGIAISNSNGLDG